MEFVVPSGYAIDPDNLMFLRSFDHPKEALVLEIGAAEEDSAAYLSDMGYRVVGIDLRKCKHDYHRLVGDFCRFAEEGVFDGLDVVYSTSALEHFGLGCYGDARDPDGDIRAVKLIKKVLKPGGWCYVTVPYGREFIANDDWRVYDRTTIRDRIIQDFWLKERVYFKSSECTVPNVNGIVEEKDADQYKGDPPHVAVFLKMQKVGE